MKITGFEIERFGIWSGLSVPKLFPGINVFYGANEAGKSTLMEFIRSELYGFGDERRRYARRPSGSAAHWNDEVDHEGRSLYTISGGVLELDCPSGSYRLRRMFRPNGSQGEESVDLRSPDGEQQGAQLLRVLVSGVDEATFNNVFAIGLDELQRLGSLNDTEAAEMLFRLSVGMDRISIVDAIKELNNRRNRILNVVEKENKPSLLTKLFRQREKIAGEIADAKLLVRDYVRIRNEQRGVDRSVAGLEEELEKQQREKRLYEVAKHCEPIWIRRENVRDEIDGMGSVLVVLEEAIAELDAALQHLEKKRFAFDRLKEEYVRARDAIHALPVNETLWKLAPRIEVLLEEEKRIVEIDAQINELESDISSLEARALAEETQIKRGRRSLPIPVSARASSVEGVSEYRPKTETEDDGKPTEHASFTASGAVISAPSTLPSIPVSAKGHRPNVESNDSVEAATLEGYRVPARQVRKTKQRLTQARDEHAEILGRSKVLGEKIKGELARRDVSELSEAVEKAAEAVTHLRRRQGIAQRMSELSMHQKELQRINSFLIRNQSMPPWKTVLLLIVGVLGAIPVGLMFFELLGVRAYHVRPELTVLGIVALGGSLFLKFFSDKNVAGRLQQNQRQLAMLLPQLEHAKQEAAAIDARYPSGGSSIEVRYQEAQQDLAHLEKLVPVDAQRREAEHQLKQIESRLARCKEEHASATRRWNDWLKASGLPTDWTPARIRDLLERCDVVGDLKRELDQRYESMNQRIRDMRNITDRIDRMIVESGLSFADGMSYVDILGEIRKKLEANDEALRQRDKLKNGLREFRKMRKKAISDLRKATSVERELLRQYGVKTGDDLRALHQRHLKHRRLLQQEQGIQRELDAAIGGFCEEPAVGNLLQPRLARILAEETETTEESVLEFSPAEAPPNEETLPTLGELLRSVQGRIEKLSTKLHAELELRGQLGEQLKQLAEDRTTIEKQRELAIVDEKIHRARAEWQNYAVCGRMLDTIRITYEKERQPRTLAEASLLLEKLTEGKYRRIWTPLGEETLLVDDNEGNTFDVVWLSRGTREQLFIALRLALASAFAQHGSILPLILDDVLVNFDSKRSLAAARVFLEFARSGRQIFLFTCHEHVCRMFQKLDVPVRILPSVADPGKPTRVLLPISIIKRREEKRRREAARLAADKRRRKLDEELARREEAIRLDALRRAEVQRLVLLMQQQATAEKAVDAERKPPSK